MRNRNKAYNTVLKFRIFSLLLVISFLPVGATEKGGDYTFSQIETGDALTQAWVNAIEQDHIGFMWVGTSDGLYRYDGYEFKTYRSRPGFLNSLPGNNITAIYEDEALNLWVATTRGLAVYDRNLDIFLSKESWVAENFTSFAENEHGDIIIGSFDGLFFYDERRDTLERHRIYENTSDTLNEFPAVCFSSAGTILVGGPEGLMSFSPKTKEFNLLTSLQGISANKILRIVEDYKGSLWISTRDFGLLYIPRGIEAQVKRLPLPNNHFLNEGSIISMMQRHDSTLWIGTENNGLVILDLRKFYDENEVDYTQIRNTIRNQVLSNNSVYALFEDDHRNVWVGTYNGLNFYNPINSNFQHTSAGNRNTDLNNEIVNAFYEDDERIWIATEGGVNILDKESGTFTYITHRQNEPATLSSNAVWAITQDRRGNMWFGTWAGGLNRYNNRTGKITRFLAENRSGKLSNNNIFSIVEDPNGKIWVGTMGGGLNLYDPETEKFTQYRHDPGNPASLSSDWVRQVFIDSHDRLWVSTNASVELFDRGTGNFHHFFSNEIDPYGLSDNGSIVVFEDSNGNMWFGTETGLNLFHAGDSTFSVFDVDDGLPSNVIMAIEEDAEGNLWLSSSNGISKFVSGSQVPDPPEFKNFDVRDGLQGNRFNRRASLQTRDGKMLFGGKNGYTSFYPEEIQLDTIKPPVVITQFLVFNKLEVVPGMEEAMLETNISQADRISLEYKNSVFTIKYAALNYLLPEKNRYMYKLEGFEEEWNEVGNQRSATYTNLDPGEYTFRVIASNSNGVWNHTGASIQIEIQPPWYRTSLAYFGYFLIISSIVLLFRRFVVIRTRLQQQLVIQNMEREKLDQINRMKTRFFTNISHEFRTPLTLIISPLESLLSDISLKPKVSNQLKVIQKNARRLLRLINQLLDISEIEADHLKLKVSKGDIVDYIREITSLFRWGANQRSIDYSFESEVETLPCYFDGDKLEKIFYNLIANAFKYTPERGTIKVHLRVVDQIQVGKGRWAEVSVKDSGIGIKEEDQRRIFEHFYRTDSAEKTPSGGSGIGLGLVKGLVNVYHGEIDLISNEGNGTEFIVRLPLDREMFLEGELAEDESKSTPVTLDIYDIEQGMAVSEEPLVDKRTARSEKESQEAQILIVEDNAELRQHLADHFSVTHKVLVAENGEIALELAGEHIPDLIISDIKMPVMDGIALCRKLKQEEKTSHIPVILLTAKVSEEDKYEGVSIGADAYITKPFEIKLLDATVRNLINLRRNLKERYTRSVVIEPTEISITSVDEKFLKKAIEIVETNIANPDYSVDAFSRDIGMSRSHLHRKFVGLTGHSPSGFIRTLRMKRAALLLTKGQLTVSEILFEVGIKSRSYFTKSFKEQFGLSPTEYVAQYQNSGTREKEN